MLRPAGGDEVAEEYHSWRGDLCGLPAARLAFPSSAGASMLGSVGQVLAAQWTTSSMASSRVRCVSRADTRCKCGARFFSRARGGHALRTLIPRLWRARMLPSGVMADGHPRPEQSDWSGRTIPHVTSPR